MVVVTVIWFVWVLMFVTWRIWGWKMCVQPKSIPEKPDYKLIAKLEREFGMVSALSEEELEREIEKANPTRSDPLLELMATMYERAMTYTVLSSGASYYTNTDPNKSILEEMFKAGT